jgi:hypothetical protein
LDLFSFKNDEPVVYVIRKEVEAMILLTNRIMKTIKDLLMHVEGSMPIPIEIEYLW